MSLPDSDLLREPPRSSCLSVRAVCFGGEGCLVVFVSANFLVLGSAFGFGAAGASLDLGVAFGLAVVVASLGFDATFGLVDTAFSCDFAAAVLLTGLSAAFVDFDLVVAGLSTGFLVLGAGTSSLVFLGFAVVVSAAVFVALIFFAAEGTAVAAEVMDAAVC